MIKKNLNDTLKINENLLSKNQKRIAHLIDPRFFDDNINPFREGKNKEDYKYFTPINLKEEFFYLHPFLDPMVLEQGNVRRFPAGVNRKYISEKYFEDKWVSNGNCSLYQKLNEYVHENIGILQEQKEIKIIDIGPCGGGITTLFALKAFDDYGLLDKVAISFLDIVPNVLEATILGEFDIPEELIEEYKLNYIGKNGEVYKDILKNGVLFGVEERYDSGNEKSLFTDDALKLSKSNYKDNISKVKYYRGDGEKVSNGIREYDVVLAGYVHHHMNFLGRKLLCEQMEEIAKEGGFIGIIDFYVKDFNEYMKRYKPHFEKYGDAPPVECPISDGDFLLKFFSKIKNININNNLEKSFLLTGTKGK